MENRLKYAWQQYIMWQVVWLMQRQNKQTNQKKQLGNTWSNHTHAEHVVDVWVDHMLGWAQFINVYTLLETIHSEPCPSGWEKSIWIVRNVDSLTFEWFLINGWFNSLQWLITEFTRCSVSHQQSTVSLKVISQSIEIAGMQGQEIELTKINKLPLMS